MPGLIPWGVLELSKLERDVNKLVDALCEDLGLRPETCRETGWRICIWRVCPNRPSRRTTPVSADQKQLTHEGSK